MTTSVDIPDELYRKAKVYAAENGLKLKDVIARGLEALISSQSNPDYKRESIKIPEAVYERCAGPVVYPVSSEELDRLMWEKNDSSNS